MLPTFETMMRPLLVALADGAEHESSELRARVAEALQLTGRDLAERLPRGGNRFTNLVAWGLHHFSRAELVERRRTSVYRLTDRGRSVLTAHPTSVDVGVCMQFDEWHQS